MKLPITLVVVLAAAATSAPPNFLPLSGDQPDIDQELSFELPADRSHELTLKSAEAAEASLQAGPKSVAAVPTVRKGLVKPKPKADEEEKEEKDVKDGYDLAIKLPLGLGNLRFGFGQDEKTAATRSGASGDKEERESGGWLRSLRQFLGFPTGDSSLVRAGIKTNSRDEGVLGGKGLIGMMLG